MSWILKNVQEFTWQRKQETFGIVERQMTRHRIVEKPAVCVVGGTGHSVLEEAEPCSPGKGAARRQNKSPCCHWPPPTPSLEGAQGVVS